MTHDAWALGLYSYSAPHPGAAGFGRFYDCALSAFQEIGIAPTYFAAEGLEYSGDLIRFGEAEQAKAVQSGFADIHGLSIAANPDGSNAPGYDSFASISLVFIESIGETLLCAAVEERYAAFGGRVFETILASLIALRSWEFGYALSQPIQKKPLFHVLGLDTGALSAEEYGLLTAWYGAPAQEKVRRIRDVYPFNIVNDDQLNAAVSRGGTLGDFIRQDGRSSLRSLNANGLWLWSVDSASLPEIRNELAGTGVLIGRAQSLGGVWRRLPELARRQVARALRMAR